MYCEECGKKIEEGSTFCTHCGHKVREKSHDKNLWSRSKAFIWIFISIVVSSIIWFLILAYNSVSVEDEAVNVVEHSLETIGRQSQAWSNSEKIIDLIGEGFSSDCLSYDPCINELTSQITTLRADIEKERVEIDNLWTTGTVSEDFQSFYNGLDNKNRLRLKKIMDLYFPDASNELETPARLL